MGEIQAGDVVGVGVELPDEASVNVSFWHNGKPLGLAFSQCKRNPGDLVHPVVQCKKVGDKVKIAFKPCFPSTVTTPPPPAAGVWELRHFQLGGVDVDFETLMGAKGKGKGRGAIRLIVSPETLASDPTSPNIFKLVFEVGNKLMTTATVTPTATGPEELSLSPVASTAMMTPLQALEEQVLSALGGMSSWLLTGSGEDLSLELGGAAGAMRFEKAAAVAVEPVTDEQLP